MGQMTGTRNSQLGTPPAIPRGLAVAELAGVVLKGIRGQIKPFALGILNAPIQSLFLAFPPQIARTGGYLDLIVNLNTKELKSGGDAIP